MPKCHDSDACSGQSRVGEFRHARLAGCSSRRRGWVQSGSSKMKVTPIGDKVVIRRLEAEAKTAGGILLPDAAQQKPQQGRVLSVGDGRLIAGGKRAPNQVREGDKVVFLTYAGTEVSVDDEELLIMREEDILAVID